jgi:hypothetical protein
MEQPTTVIELALDPLHPGQRDFVLSGLDRAASTETSQCFAVAGRGWGKTRGLIARLVLIAFRQPGIPILVTEPTWQHVRDVFLREWRAIVPQELWHWSGGENKRLTLFTTPPTEVDVRSRGADNAERDMGFRGQTYGAILHDELAQDRTRSVFDAALGTLRHRGATHRSCDAISTPKIGWFRDLAESGPVRLIHGATRDNPYGGNDTDALLRGTYSPDLAAQELDAQWVAFSGRVFSGWVDALWPLGNRVAKTWNPDQPWQLWLDFGLRQAAWIVVQTHLVGGKQRDVIVAEHLSDTDDLGTLDGARRVAKWAGRPPSVIYYDPSGNTAEVADRSMGSRRALEMTWGSSPKYHYPSGWARGKEIQIDVLRNQIRGLGDVRNLLVSASLLSDGRRCVHNDARPGTDSSQSGRGVLEVFRELTWDAAKTDASLRGNPLEHVLDALCYGTICRHRPMGGVAERA